MSAISVISINDVTTDHMVVLFDFIAPTGEADFDIAREKFADIESIEWSREDNAYVAEATIYGDTESYTVEVQIPPFTPVAVRKVA